MVENSFTYGERRPRSTRCGEPPSQAGGEQEWQETNAGITKRFPLRYVNTGREPKFRRTCEALKRFSPGTGLELRKNFLPTLKTVVTIADQLRDALRDDTVFAFVARLHRLLQSLEFILQALQLQ